MPRPNRKPAKAPVVSLQPEGEPVRERVKAPVIADDAMDAFRRNPVKVERMREILSDAIMQEAIIILQDGDVIDDVDNDLFDSIASVRKLSRLVGAKKSVQKLFELATPYQEPPQLGKEDWGMPAEEQTES